MWLFGGQFLWSGLSLKDLWRKGQLVQFQGTVELACVHFQDAVGGDMKRSAGWVLAVRGQHLLGGGWVGGGGEGWCPVVPVN